MKFVHSVLISLLVAAVCFFIGLSSHNVTVIIAGFVMLAVGAVVPAATGKISGRVLTVTVAIVVAVIVIFSVIPVMQTVGSTSHGQKVPTPVILQTIMPKGAVFAYSPNGTVTTVNAKSSAVYGMVYSGIEMNITVSVQLVGSWASTTPVSAIIVPLQYMHNVSVLGKVLSTQTLSLSGKLNYNLGAPQPHHPSCAFHTICINCHFRTSMLICFAGTHR